MNNDHTQQLNICTMCKNEVQCFINGIFRRTACAKWDPGLFSSCPECGNGNREVHNATTVRRCLHCGTYWCVECGHTSKTLPRGAACPHWYICEKCGCEYRHVDSMEYILMRRKICGKCEYYKVECQGTWKCKNPRERNKWIRSPCPYDCIRSNGPGISQCPEIRSSLRRQREASYD